MNSEQLAWKIKRHGIEMTHISGGSHIGSVLSVSDIIGVLYADIMNYDCKNPKWDKRDRIILHLIGKTVLNVFSLSTQTEQLNKVPKTQDLQVP